LTKGELPAGSEIGQQMQMMGVIWFIVECDTGNADRPGKIGGYAATPISTSICISRGR
jgi:hypothetical protein